MNENVNVKTEKINELTNFFHEILRKFELEPPLNITLAIIS